MLLEDPTSEDDVFDLCRFAGGVGNGWGGFFFGRVTGGLDLYSDFVSSKICCTELPSWSTSLSVEF